MNNVKGNWKYVFTKCINQQGVRKYLFTVSNISVFVNHSILDLIQRKCWISLASLRQNVFPRQLNISEVWLLLWCGKHGSQNCAQQAPTNNSVILSELLGTLIERWLLARRSRQISLVSWCRGLYMFPHQAEPEFDISSKIWQIWHQPCHIGGQPRFVR